MGATWVHARRWLYAIVVGGVAAWGIASAFGINSTDDGGTRLFSGVVGLVGAAYAIDRATLGYRVRQQLDSSEGRLATGWVGDVTISTTYITPIPQKSTTRQPHAFLDDGKYVYRYPIRGTSAADRKAWAEPASCSVWTVDRYVVAKSIDGRILWPSGGPKRFARPAVKTPGVAGEASPGGTLPPPPV